MKISVIGTINNDLILPFRGTSIQSIGGIFYTISTLSKLSGDSMEIVPYTHLGTDLHAPFESLLEQYPNISRDGLQQIEQLNHKVILEYVSELERQEKALFNFPPLEWEQIAPAADADFVMINLISGWDVSLQAVTRLSRKVYPKLYLDVHFLTMGLDKLGRRFPQRPDNIEQWLQSARFVQMNEREFRTIAGEEVNEVLFFEKYFRPDQVLLVTFGNRGARLIFRKDQIIRNKDFPAVSVKTPVDVTGCGDVFGAAFVYNYLKTNQLYPSIEFANRAAAANSLLRGTNEMDKLVPLMQKLEQEKAGQ